MVIQNAHQTESFINKELYIYNVFKAHYMYYIEIVTNMFHWSKYIGTFVCWKKSKIMCSY